jgi:hypothetical protein
VAGTAAVFRPLPVPVFAPTGIFVLSLRLVRRPFGGFAFREVFDFTFLALAITLKIQEKTFHPHPRPDAVSLEEKTNYAMR